MEIRTERLLLRRPQLDDLDAMFEIMSNPAAMRYWSTLPHASRDVTRPWLDKMIARNAGGGEDFLIEHDGKVIGYVGAGRPPISAS
ncbi:MAG: acetyltransferase [Devosia sp.]|nr:acetyltransferase [Devosia sp.]